jgi:hypothetical protein
MEEYIYALYLKVAGEELFYYIGRTNNLERRMKEHEYGAKTGTEHKYQFMRENADYEWGYKVLHQCVRTDDSCFEEFYQLKFLRDGWPLTNMKGCDAFHTDYITSAVGKQIYTVAQLRAHKQQQRIEFLRNKDKRPSSASDTTVFVDDLAGFLRGKQESQGLREARAKLKR